MNLMQAVPRSCALTLNHLYLGKANARSMWSQKKVNTLLSDGKCDCGSRQRPFLTQHVQPNLAFSLIQVIPSLDLFQNR